MRRPANATLLYESANVHVSGGGGGGGGGGAGGGGWWGGALHMDLEGLALTIAKRSTPAKARIALALRLRYHHYAIFGTHGFKPA